MNSTRQWAYFRSLQTGSGPKAKQLKHFIFYADHRHLPDGIVTTTLRDTTVKKHAQSCRVLDMAVSKSPHIEHWLGLIRCSTGSTIAHLLSLCRHNHLHCWNHKRSLTKSQIEDVPFPSTAKNFSLNRQMPDHLWHGVHISYLMTPFPDAHLEHCVANHSVYAT
jgi:hypothetical protein